MKVRKLFATAIAIGVLAISGTSSSAQVSEQAARDKARSVVRSQLGLGPEQFLDAHRDEGLEEELEVIVGGLAGSEFIYRISQAGDEIKDHVVVHHQFVDSDPRYLVVVSPIDGSTYRIAGFRDSKAEFNKLMAALGVKISSQDQAEALADFYRTVNPEHRSMIRVPALLDLKQAAEWQCQAVPFDAKEKDFEAWWKHAKSLYASASFQQTATRDSSGYAVEWIVLSSPGAGMCGGAALRARLEVGSDGQVGDIAFSPLEPAAGRR